MTTIKIQFQSNGETVKKTAIINDSLDELSQSKKNQASFIEDGYIDDGYWSILFDGENDTLYEVEFKYDKENYRKTLEPRIAITWIDDIIDDVQTASVTIK